MNKLDDLHDLLVTNISKMNESLRKKEEEKKPKCHTVVAVIGIVAIIAVVIYVLDRKSTRLNSSH